MNTKLLITFAVAILSVQASLQAAVSFEDGETGYSFGTDAGATLQRSTEQAHSGLYSAKLQLSDANPSADFAKINVPWTSSTLGQTSATCWDYVPSSNVRSDVAPYLYFIVDCNSNGLYDYPNDGLVIAFVTGSESNPTDAWFQTSLDSTTKVHVVGNRTGLGATEFSSSNGLTMGTLADLCAKPYSGATTWGDLSMVMVRAGAGEWPGATGYTAYVDDLTVVPEPATMCLLGVGAVALIRRRK